jgi:carbon monoxide dehydrogenase subunit G
MRRLIVESESTKLVGASLARVSSFLADFPRAIRLLPMVCLVEHEGPERFRVHLGPFGVGGFQGTLKLVVQVRLESAEDRCTQRITTLAGEGNTDASIDFEAVRGPEGCQVRCHVWASPRREIPSMLPLSLVRRAATKVLHAALDEGLESLERELRADARERESQPQLQVT